MFETRAFSPATDFPALVELLNAVAKVDGVALTTEAEQRDSKELFEKYGYLQQWVMPGSSPNTFIAYTWLYKQSATPYAEYVMAVHPKFREQGLEKKLLETIIAEAKNQKAIYLYDLVDAKNVARQTFLLQQGFKSERGFRLMVLEALASLPAPVLPPQLLLRTYDQVNDMKIMVEIANRGWSDLPGHKVASGENVDWVNQQPHDSIFFLFDKHNKVIGCTSAKVTEDGRGKIDSPALVSEYRQPELYRALVVIGLQYLVSQGCTEVILESWGDYDSTITAYLELGFKTTIHELGYRLDLM